MSKFSVAHLIGWAAVKLHYRKKLDIYSLCSIYEPELYARSQRKAAIPSRVRWDVWMRDDFTCHYCGDWGHHLTLDHVIPETYGGEAIPENLVTACQSCNRKKSSTSYEKFLTSKWLRKKKAHQQRSSITRQQLRERIPPAKGLQ